jgi:hypothetical protein
MPHTLDSAVLNINENTNQCHDSIVRSLNIVITELKNIEQKISYLDTKINNLQSSVSFIQSNLQSRR